MEASPIPETRFVSATPTQVERPVHSLSAFHLINQYDRPRRVKDFSPVPDLAGWIRMRRETKNKQVHRIDTSMALHLVLDLEQKQSSIRMYVYFDQIYVVKKQ